ncbi:uncharacterized protein CIMG_13325 [Coccidioides immitis RS]|uniref:Uncharacterized protein n=1 Tax=Coccidioides immitis (strain RS) TaxID=246410 RepID=A0A0D8JUV0_COCIM|nr:uncharacterized protein CIMG_13325 [Coccidioides immitis RS]KJF60924.1 hypothetical protein CIMG_13325 [Coccidioides immitis RS]
MLASLPAYRPHWRLADWRKLRFPDSGRLLICQPANHARKGGLNPPSVPDLWRTSSLQGMKQVLQFTYVPRPHRVLLPLRENMILHVNHYSVHKQEEEKKEKEISRRRKANFKKVIPNMCGNTSWGILIQYNIKRGTKKEKKSKVK